MNLLIAVTTRNSNYHERLLYQVPEDAPMKVVVAAAVGRSELTGHVWCTNIEVLGSLPITQTYVNLLDPRDVTDLTS